MDVDKIKGNIDEDVPVKSVRIRVGRSIEGFGLSPGITKEQRLEQEKLMVNAFAKLEADLDHTQQQAAAYKSKLEAAREKYKRTALAAKTGGDRQTALEMMKMIKTCDNLLLEVRQGNVVDLNLIRQSETQVCR